MNQVFELGWMGGAAERSFRRRRPEQNIEAFPWDSLHTTDYPPELLAAAQASWTEGAFAEYCTGASFSALARSLLEAGAPIDLVGMTGDFVADEMFHVELNARMAMQFGGAAPRLVNFADLVPNCTPPGLSPFHHATELAVRICIAEAITVPILSEAARAASHPLTQGVLRRIARDEGPHAALGWLVLEWAAPKLSLRDRKRLGHAAAESVAYFRAVRADVETQSVLSEEAYGAMGWLTPARYVQVLDEGTERRVWTPLQRFDIFPETCDALEG